MLNLQKTAENTVRYTPQQLYKALASAETHGLRNPWIRTQVRPRNNVSTAYGPVQLTEGLLRDYLNRRPEMFVGKARQTFAHRMLNQAQAFRRHGKTGARKRAWYNPAFDYGGKGNLPAAMRPHYQQVSMGIIDDMYRRGGYNLNALMRRWRGVSPDKVPTWRDRVLAALRKEQ